MLDAAKDAGNDGLEDVLAKLYATKFTKNTPSALACKREQSTGLEARFGTMMDSITDSVGPYPVRSLPYERAIIKASVPLYKREFESFSRYKDLRKRLINPEEMEKKVGERAKPYLYFRTASITPNFLASFRMHLGFKQTPYQYTGSETIVQRESKKQ